MNNETMLGGVGLEPSGIGHRHLSVRKTENGFLVDAAFNKKHPPTGLAEDGYFSPERKEFVFYTVPEVLDFVKQYLEAPAEEI